MTSKAEYFSIAIVGGWMMTSQLENEIDSEK